MQDKVVTTILGQLDLEVAPEKLITLLKANGYADHTLLADLFNAKRKPLLKDLKQSCQISDQDFSKLEDGYNRVR